MAKLGDIPVVIISELPVNAPEYNICPAPDNNKPTEQKVMVLVPLVQVGKVTTATLDA
jgi:hypothetical protein